MRVWGPGFPLEDLVAAGLTRLRLAVVAADAVGREGSRLMDMPPFDLLGPLPTPRSTTVLEASAGTGKTFALAGLVTRYVAEGVATLDQMLLITFGRAASQELRERVRGQILEALLAFDDPSGDYNDLVKTCSTANPTSWPSASCGCVTRWRASTRRPSPPHTSSASWC